MNDFRGDIPIRAFLNALVVDRAVQTSMFQECVRDVITDAGAPDYEYQFKNPAYIVGLLYCLVLVPKELWIDDQTHWIYAHPDICALPDLFDFVITDPQFNTNRPYYLIRRLRNALAHVRFSVDQSQGFEFWDQPSLGATPNFRAKVSNANLFRVINLLGHHIKDIQRRSGGT